MAVESTASLLQRVAERILAKYLDVSGYSGVSNVNGKTGFTDTGVDIVYRNAGSVAKVKVKPDTYYGDDPLKVRDRELPLYRSDMGHYAFEAVSDSLTREPGWMFRSQADELFYYYLVIGQREDEVAALASEPDEVFFGELRVERDELVVIPMREARRWFEAHFEEYTPRPVIMGAHTAWYRLIPSGDIDNAVKGIKRVGSVFGSLAA